MKCIQVSEDDTEVIKVVKTKMSEEMNARTESEDLALIAAFLNPDTKELTFLSPEDKDRTMGLIRDNLCHGYVRVKKEPHVETVEPELPVPPKGMSDLNTEEPVPMKIPKIMCSDSDDWLQDVIVTGESYTPVQDLIELEVKRYVDFQRKTTDSSLTLLEWWKVNEPMFPRLAQLAKRILAVPASSVPSERVFSLAGNIVSKKRSRINPEKVDMMIFLNMNMKTYW